MSAGQRGRRAARDPGRGLDQVVRRGAGAARYRPVGAARDGARRARSQRGGEDHGGADPDHAAAFPTKGGRWSRAMTWCATRPRSAGPSGWPGQSAAIQEELTGRENLEIIGRLYHLSWPHARSRAVELLEQFGLSDAADRAAKNYSGGMQRRLDLAASLVGRPKVLFLDEPTTGLDPRSQAGDVGHHPVAGRRRDHAAADHPVPGRGRRAGGRDRGHRPRPGHRRGHLRGAEGPGRRRRRRVHRARPRAGSTTRRPRSPRSARASRTRTPSTGVVSLGVGGRGSDALVEAVRSLDAAGVETRGLALRRPSLDDVFLAPDRARRRGRGPAEGGAAAGGVAGAARTRKGRRHDRGSREDRRA